MDSQIQSQRAMTLQSQQFVSGAPNPNQHPLREMTINQEGGIQKSGEVQINAQMVGGAKVERQNSFALYGTKRNAPNFGSHKMSQPVYLQL